MNHPNDEDLVLHLYGEETEAGARRHLAECRECFERVEEMRRLLWAVDAQPVPHRDERYGARVWDRLQKRLDAEGGAQARALPSSGIRGWALAAAAAAIAVIAFLVGRGTVTPPAPAASAALSADAQERILRDAVSRHLDRSRRVLTEASNASGERLPALRAAAP